MPKDPLQLSYAVEIIGSDHPHKGERGECDQGHVLRLAGIGEPMFKITFPDGAACFALADEIKRL